METEQYVSRYMRMLSCKYAACFWHCDAEMALLSTDCPSAGWWMGFFDHVGYRDAVLEHFSENTVPLLIGDSLGIMWGIVREPGSGHFYILGPVLNNECAVSEMWEFFHTSRMAGYGRTHGLGPAQTQRRMQEEIQSLPLVLIIEFSGDVMMLHCCVTGEVIHRSDLKWRRERLITPESKAPRQKDRQRTYNFSQALMRAVEEGDLSYQTLLDQAPAVSNGVPLRSGDPLLQAKLSVFTFSQRCTDAAIRGGLTPDQAYSLGDGYTQLIMDAANLSDLPTISHTMYSDFIHAVHKHNSGRGHSRLTERCIHYIADHIEEEITLSALSGYLGYSGNYISRRFRQEVGISLKDYIISARVEHAKLILLACPDPISKTAERLGYSSSNYFVRQFRKATGMTPLQWRAQNVNK